VDFSAMGEMIAPQEVLEESRLERPEGSARPLAARWRVLENRPPPAPVESRAEEVPSGEDGKT
jgi:hypothetical protein